MGYIRRSKAGRLARMTFAEWAEEWLATAVHLKPKTKVGYEIPFTRHFYTYTPPRPLDAIDADLQKVSREIMDLLAEVTR